MKATTIVACGALVAALTLLAYVASKRLVGSVIGTVVLTWVLITTSLTVVGVASALEQDLADRTQSALIGIPLILLVAAQVAGLVVGARRTQKTSHAQRLGSKVP